MIIIGSQGFIGSHFCQALPNAFQIDRSQLDLCRPQFNFSLRDYRYALITAGVGNPRKCEEDPQGSYRCNVEGSIEVGKELLKRGIIPIFFSSDYVFDDALNKSPLNEYGRQKAELEREASKLDALVVRLSKVYGLKKGDGSLFDEMAEKLTAGQQIRAARDQIFAPIYIGDVICQVLSLLEKEIRGIENVVGPSFASRLEMAQKVAETLAVKRTLVKEISLDDLNDGVQRPKFLKIESSVPGLSWQEGIQRMVEAYAQ